MKKKKKTHEHTWSKGRDRVNHHRYLVQHAHIPPNQTSTKYALCSDLHIPNDINPCYLDSPL